MKVDTHIHLYDPAAGNFSWPEPGSPLYRAVLPADFIRVAAPHRIDRAIVIACTTQPEQTELILQTMHNDPAIAAVIGYVEISTADFGQLYERFCHYPKFRGFRFFCDGTLDDQAIRNVALMTGKEANVLEFLGTHIAIAKMRSLIEANPGVNFVIEHFARERTDVRIVPTDFMDFLNEMASYNHVYLKLSAIVPLAGADRAPTASECYAPILEASYRAFGEDRCLFGSDWPFLELKGEYITAVQATETFLSTKPSAAREKVMGHNAVKVYNL